MDEELPRHSFTYKLARLALVAAWVYPALAALAPDGLPVWFVLLPSGPGIIDSNRSLLFLFCGAAFFLSGSRLDKTIGTGLGISFLGWTVVCSLGGESKVDSLLFSTVWFAAGCALVSARTLQPPRWSEETRRYLLHGLVLAVNLPAIYRVLMEPQAGGLAGPFQLPNVFANWQLALLPLLLEDLLLRSRPLSWVSTTLALMSLALTQSRSTWVMTSLAICLSVLILEGTPPKRLMGYGATTLTGMGVLFAARAALGGVLTLVLAALLLLIPALIEGFRGTHRSHLKIGALLVSALLLYTGTLHLADSRELLSATETRMNNLVKGDNSTNTRLELWKAAVLLTLEHPIKGTGPATFSEYYPSHQTHFYHYSDSPHSAALELSSETGLVGLALLLALAFWWLKSELSFQLPGDPTRRSALLGVLLGLLEAQVDVSYQFPELWVTMAVLWAVAVGPNTSPRSNATGMPAKAAAAVLVLASAVLVIQQRDFESTRTMADSGAVYRKAREISTRLPGWSKPTLTALDAGLLLAAEMPASAQRGALLQDLSFLAQKAVKANTHSPRAYILQGRVFLAQNKLGPARESFQRALAIDPYNFPAAYQGLLETASAAHHTSEADEVVNKVLSLYQLPLLELAHAGHRETLVNQLVPLYFVMADLLNPFEQPQKTEPFLRFLVTEVGGPRANYGLGAALWAKGERQEARAYFEAAHRADSRFPASP